MPTSKPSSFIMSSDFSTLKNDNAGSVTVTIPGSVTVLANSDKEYYADLVVGQIGAISINKISSSKDSNNVIPCSTVGYVRTGAVGGFPAIYSIMAIIRRINSTTIRCSGYIKNPYSATLTTAATDEIITFNVLTYIPPFI